MLAAESPLLPAHPFEVTNDYLAAHIDELVDVTFKGYRALSWPASLRTLMACMRQPSYKARSFGSSCPRHWRGHTGTTAARQ